VVVLGLLAKGGRAYCNLLCPIGALDALANTAGARFGRRVRVSATHCNGCGLCEPVCPTWAIKIADTAKIDPLGCMPCRRCETACPQGAVTYAKTAPATYMPEWRVADGKA